MSKPFDLAALPEDIALAAQAVVAAGRFASVEDVIRAGVHAAAGPDLVEVEDEAAFVAAVREGQAQLARGEGRPHDEVMARARHRLAEHVQRHARR